MNKKFLSIIALICILPISSHAGSVNDSTDNRLEEISRNLDLFNLLFKELDSYYVDTIDSKKVLRTGIDAMVSKLDPYTIYIPEEEEEDFNFMITGEYAGVGASIGKVGDYICFTEIYEGSPAYKNGIKAGDRIIEIAGKNASKMSVSDISEHLRGEKSTNFKIVLQNPITGKQRKLTITREKITLPTIEYCDTLEKGIGYIRFSSFTEKSAELFKNAFLDLKENKKIESLIIDLRNNPGGLLDQVTEIVNYFIENQSVIVYTKSKVKALDETYKATKNPIDNKIPIVVLVNNNSASASEVFSGAMQDLDRAVIVGERTYGKGLVQTSRPLPFGGNLKVTISKYYIPSGRCVQAINYAERNEDGSVKRIPDSLTTEFKTKNGRIVRDGGGILPDVKMERKELSTISYYLYKENIIFNYAVNYIATHSKIDNPKEFQYTEYEQFKEYAKKQKFSYKLKMEEYISALKDIAKDEGYLEHSQNEFDALEKKLSHNLDQDLNLFEKEIRKLISLEIMKQLYNQKGYITESLKYDKMKEEAIKILKDKERYNSILQPKAEEKTDSQKNSK
ncbi:MAG: S41 family peptidase [Paludibacteraceae bacterium]|nr:S41 family peptidase [Paludibacteraceae bacterium]